MRGALHPKRFINSEGNTIDGLAINPLCLRSDDLVKTLSLLVHMMCIVWYFHSEPNIRLSSYCGKKLGAQMKRVGLMPSTTGAPGGEETGKKMSHYIIEGGRFDEACKRFIKDGFKISWSWIEVDEEPDDEWRRSKYVCKVCDTNLLGKPGLRFTCDECGTKYVAVEKNTRPA
jgi:predicted RNA-binding Zn-ribbon protein involved in translation (DUF1610 family)